MEDERIGMMSLHRAEQALVTATDGGLYYVRFSDDSPAAPIDEQLA